MILQVTVINIMHMQTASEIYIILKHDLGFLN